MSWGQWKCACGNIQSGSQCKGCRSKYWEVEWEAVPSGAGGKPQATRAPWAKPVVPQPKAFADAPLLSQLDQFLSNTTLPAELGGPAATLRNALRVRAPPSSQRQKLKSVMDKIDHHKSQIHKTKKRLKDLEAERAALDEQLMELEGGLTTLEHDKEALCNLVAGTGPDEDTASEEGSDDSDGRSTPNSACAVAFLQRLDPQRVLQWAQAQLNLPGGPPVPEVRHDPTLYHIGDTHMDGESGA